MSNRGTLVRQALYSALNSLAVQGIAIIVLSPANYGLFALYFLVFAFMSSLALSTVCEAWVRVDVADRASWPEYCTALCLIAGVSLIPSSLLGAATGSTVAAVASAAAVLFATLRVGARYFATVTNAYKYVGPADIASILAMAGTFTLARNDFSDLEAVSLAWGASAIVAMCFSKPIRITVQRGPRWWYQKHKASIRPLLTDSVLLDIGAVGVPLAISPILGIASFGVYRSVSSAALPVRLILTPLRPLMERRRLPFFLSARVILAVTTSGFAIGVSVLVVLLVIDVQSLFSDGVLGQLAHFALPVGLFVMFNFVGNFYYLVSRTHSSGSTLMLYRFVTLTGAITLPLVGVLVGGLSGAIWGFVSNSIVLSFFIVELLRRERNALT